MSFADTKLKIDKKKAKYEALLKSPNIAERTAAMLMYSRAVNAGNLLFDEQEAQKPAVEPTAVPKFKDGGTTMNNDGTYSEDETAKPTGFEKWTKQNNQMSMVSGVLTGIDYFTKMAAIKNMQAPPKPITAPLTHLNKILNTGAERNAMTRSRITAERTADQIPGLQVSTALKQKAGVDYLNNISKVSEKEQNYATDRENTEAMLNQRTSMYNVDAFNNYTNNLNDFYNQKTAAKQGALSNMLTKGSMVLKDNLSNKSDMMKWALQVMKYDPTVAQEMIDALNK